MSPRRCLPLLILALVLPCAPASAAAVPEGFYSAKPGTVPKGHGLLIKSLRISGGSLPTAGRSYAVLYSSRAGIGKSTPVSGVVTIPKGKAPKGGFPVVSWAHGTVGIADSCAPSKHLTEAPTSEYYSDLQAEMTHWVKEGFVVARTDYEGLGTRGRHPFLIGESEGRSVIDIVSAARGLSAGVGRRWAAVGHSQGGHAVLWAAALASTYAPALKLLGAVPLAPASHIGEEAELVQKIDGNPFGGLPALIVSAGLDRGGFDIPTALSDRALALYPQIDELCLPDLGKPESWGGLPLKEIFREGYEVAPLANLLSSNDPEDLTVKVPLLIAQGKDDTTVFPAFTDDTVSKLRGRGARVSYKQYDGVTHSTVVEAARADTDRFLDRRLGG